MGSGSRNNLKAKVNASIVAISAIELLKALVHIGSGCPGAEAVAWGWTAEDKALAWKVVIHVVLVISGVLFAVMDKIGGGHGAGGGSY